VTATSVCFAQVALQAPRGRFARDDLGVWGATEQKRHLSSVACSDRCKTRAIVPKKLVFAFPTGHWRFAKTAAKVGSRSMFCENAVPGQAIAAMMRAQNMLSKA
jgi:hypothetical protein